MQELKRGYTTGTCATAASKAAMIGLITGDFPKEVEIEIPNGEVLTIPVRDCTAGEGWASCAVKKYSGDDPDVTAGTLIFSKIEGLPRGTTPPEGAIVLPD